MNKVFILVMLAIIMLVIAIPFIIRSILWNRVLNHLHKGNHEKVLVMLNSNLFRLFFKEYDRNYNILRVYLSQGDNRQIEAQTKKMLDSNLSKQQAYQIASQTYFYFLDRENKEICKRLLEHMEHSAKKDELEYDQMLYRIIIEKKSEDIQNIENMLRDKEVEKVKKYQKEDQQVQIGLLQYLLGLQYSYQKNREKMELYLKKAKVNLKGTPYHKKIKRLLD